MTQSRSRVTGSNEIRGVTLPVGERSLLLPNAAVAELIAYQAPEPQSGAPDWLLGHLDWRGVRIPVVSVEKALQIPAAAAESKRMRIAVLNTLNGNEKLPYIGVLTVGISRLARIHPDSLAEDPDDPIRSELILKSVQMADQPAWIPDLDALEKWISALG